MIIENDELDAAISFDKVFPSDFKVCLHQRTLQVLSNNFSKSFQLSTKLFQFR